MTKKSFNRRRFLRGLGGAVIGLPALDAFQRNARAAATPAKIYSAWMLQANGLVQGPHAGTGGGPVTPVVAGAPPETDMFWPSAMGPISAAAMAGVDAAQATSVLKDYAAKLIFLRGSSFKHGFMHWGGPIAAMTAAQMTGNSLLPLPVSESAEFFISRTMAGGKPPLTLFAGRKASAMFRGDCFSFGMGGGQPRVGESNPYNAFQDMVGLTDMKQNDPAVAARLAAQDLSVNDLIRGELKELLARTDLSMEDRRRVDLHLTSVRDMEVRMTTVSGPQPDVTALTSINGQYDQDLSIENAALLQMDLIAFAFASDLYRTASLQVGAADDHTRYTVDGVLALPYHQISHRNDSERENGPVIANAVQVHHGIDKIHAGMFKRLLDKLALYTLPGGGTLLDSSINVWTNSLDDGPTHGSNAIPYVLAGGAGGFLRTGVHMTLPAGTANNLVLNTVISATGCRKANGDPVDNFGDPAFPGIVNQIVA